jgi:hypothetical protein
MSKPKNMLERIMNTGLMAALLALGGMLVYSGLDYYCGINSPYIGMLITGIFGIIVGDEMYT